MVESHDVAVDIPLLQQTSRSQAPTVDLRLDLTQLYDALPLTEPRCIRLLNIEAGSSSTPLRGTLRVVNLQTSPNFNALSYVWGRSGSTQYSISCNGVDVPLTKSCHQALCALRSIYGVVSVWVDAICIHQGNDNEKEVQIPLMSEIYTWARAVYVWLGLETDQSAKAIDWLLTVTKFQQRAPAMEWAARRRRFPISVMTEQLECIMRTLTNSLLRPFAGRIDYDIPVEAIDSLLDRDWQHRAWTFQEIILASNPIIVCGDKAIDWTRLQGGMAILSNCIMADQPLWNWSFKLMEAAKLKDSNKYKKHDGNTSPSIDAWQMLFQVWMSAPRPTCWNGTTVRYSPTKSTDGSNQWSVDTYQQRFIKPAHFLRRLFMAQVLALGYVLFLPVLLILQLLLYPQTKYVINLSSLYFGAWIAASLFMYFVYAFTVGATRTYRDIALRPRVSAGQAQLDDTTPSLHGILEALRDRKACEAKDFKPLGLVYKDLFTDLAKWNPALINLLIDVGPALPGTPSWVPDWSTIRERKWLDLAYAHDALTQDDESTSDDKFVMEDDELIIRGIKLASVTWASPVFRHILTRLDTWRSERAEGSLQWAIELLSTWIFLLRRDVPIVATYDSVPRTAFGILRGSATGSTEAENIAFSECFRILVKYVDASNSHDSANASLSQSRMQATYDAFRHKDSALRALVTVVNMMIKSKRGVFLADGHACSGPDHMAEGDELLILKGVSVPMVARRLANSQPVAYTLLGPAYVPGFMGLLRWDSAELGQSCDEYRFQ